MPVIYPLILRYMSLMQRHESPLGSELRESPPGGLLTACRVRRSSNATAVGGLANSRRVAADSQERPTLRCLSFAGTLRIDPLLWGSAFI